MSDSRIILEILNEFHNFLTQLNISDSLLNRNLIQQLIKNSSLDYTENDISELMGPADKYSQDLKKKIILSNKDESIEKILKSLSDVCFNEFDNKKIQILKWCNDRNVNYDIMSNYFKNYTSMKSLIIRNMTQDVLDFISDIQKSFDKEYFKMNKSIDYLDVALFFGFPFNVCKKIKSTDYYLSLYSPVLTNSMQVASFSPYKFVPNTFVSVQYLQDYILYLKIDTEKDTITFLHHITPELITIMSHIYSRKHFDRMRVDEKEIINFITDKNTKYLVFKNKNIIGSNLSHAIIGYNETLKLIKKDCIPLVDSVVIDFIRENSKHTYLNTVDEK
jgi:hypothetical protein